MTTELHPDHLQPGGRVGPWRILELLGSGGFGRVFKVERDGAVYALKMALRPVTLERLPGEEDFNGRLAHEVATLLAYRPHSDMPRVHAMDRWPDSRTGYCYFVTDYVEGDTLLEWCFKTRPTVTQLVDVFMALVRRVGELHRRGVYHRDLKASNILIRKGDEKPVIIDFGVASLPRATTLTVGLTPGSLYMQPPEVIAFARSQAWKKGAHFEGSVAADLYALGVQLYEVFTEHHPFDPKLPEEELLLAIETAIPRAPHYINPKVPRPLSDLTMRLLEKRPEDRPASTEALLKELWEVAKERGSPAWKGRFVLPEEGPAEVTPEELAERRARMQAARRQVREKQEQEEQPPREAPGLKNAPGEQRPPAGHRKRLMRWLLVPLAGVLLLGLASWLVRSTLVPTPSEKGTTPVPTLHTPQDSLSSSRDTSRTALLTATLCALTGLGCPAAQVIPKGGPCPDEARHAMFEVLKLDRAEQFMVILDVNQPGDWGDSGVFQDGPVVGRVERQTEATPGLPAGTLLYGRLWTNVYDHRNGAEAMAVRYTEALLPDGRKLPVCIVLGGAHEGVLAKHSGSKPGAARQMRVAPVMPVRKWPEVRSTP